MSEELNLGIKDLVMRESLHLSIWASVFTNCLLTSNSTILQTDLENMTKIMALDALCRESSGRTKWPKVASKPLVLEQIEVLDWK